MDDISEARLQNVSPLLATKVRQMSDILISQGIYVRVVQGLRTWAEQDELYAQGRTKRGPIVTNAAGGHSYHNFGLAVDCVPSRGGVDAPYVPDWNHNNPAWSTMVATGQRLGLTSGARWIHLPDWPHFQLQGTWPVGAPPDIARAAFVSEGLAGVWKAAGIAAAEGSTA